MSDQTDTPPPFSAAELTELRRFLTRIHSDDQHSAQIPVGELPLSDLPAAIVGRYGSSPSYRHIHARVIDGQLPQVFRTRGRWKWRAGDLDAIAAALGYSAGQNSEIAG